MADIAEIITEKKDLSVINIDKPQKADSTELKNVLVLPHYSVPTGNIYDVFFWHNPKDRNWVDGLVKRLESPGFGLRCSILPIDVDLADPVTHDVRRYVESSRRTIGVFSPDYLKWFRRKTGITLQTNYDPNQRLLARIIFGQGACPEHIEILHIIEEGSELFWKQLRAAILMTDDFVDNEKIAEVPVYIGRNCCPQPTPEKGPIPKELLFRGSELGLSVEKYQEIIKIVMKTPFDGLRRHSEYMLVSFCTSLAYLFQFLCLMIWFIVGPNNAAHHVTQETHSAQNINHKQTRESDVILLRWSIVLCWVQFFTCCLITYQQRIYRKTYVSKEFRMRKSEEIKRDNVLSERIRESNGCLDKYVECMMGV